MFKTTRKRIRALRDSQRSKVYAAERSIGAWERKSDYIEDMDDLEVYIAKILTSKWLLKHFPKINPKVKDGRGCRFARGSSGQLVLPKWSRFKLVILHEICHAITLESPWHGRYFCKNYIKLVQHFLSKEDAIELKASFKKFRVKYSLPKKGAGRRGGNPAGIAALKKWREEKKANQLDV